MLYTPDHADAMLPPGVNARRLVTRPLQMLPRVPCYYYDIARGATL